MRRTTPAARTAALVAAGAAAAAALAATPQPEVGPFLGHDNIPAVCEAEMDQFLDMGWETATPVENPRWWFAAPPVAEDGTAKEHPARCHHMGSDMNGLDDPVVDVLIVPPAAPVLERDMRIMRQSVEMWAAGIDLLAQQLEMQWLADGMDVRISIGALEHGELAFEPNTVADPEIVVIATNPVGGVGIGIDPVDFAGDLVGAGGGESPIDDSLLCTGIPNPFGEFAAWEALEGFDSHHGTRTGTYTAECGDELGGNVCFAVNGAIDPLPENTFFYDNVIDFNLFDLVSHELGHCLTIGHVGDGAEGDWGEVAKDDIMAYDPDPQDLTKCVSTLNVVGIATVMARYLDVDGDGTPGTEADQALVLPNDPVTVDGRPFVVHRPADQFYASATGAPTDCPQPDLGVVPGERTDWSPVPEWDMTSKLDG